MHGDINRFQAILNDVLNIRLFHIGERHIVALQETEARIIILKIKRIPHSARHLVDKAKDAAV